MVKEPVPEYVSVPKAAEMLGCTDVWVIKMVQAGTLDGFKLSGRAWAIKRTSVEKNLQEYLERDPTASGRRRSKLG